VAGLTALDIWDSPSSEARQAQLASLAAADRPILVGLVVGGPQIIHVRR
jgi:hypothetical protein